MEEEEKGNLPLWLFSPRLFFFPLSFSQNSFFRYTQLLGYTTDIGYTGITVQSTGGSAAHENRPPFFALAYVMKL